MTADDPWSRKAGRWALKTARRAVLAPFMSSTAQDRMIEALDAKRRAKPKKQTDVPQAKTSSEPGRPPSALTDDRITPERKALIDEAIAIHRSKRKALDTLPPEQRAMLQEMAEAMFFGKQTPLDKPIPKKGDGDGGA